MWRELFPLACKKIHKLPETRETEGNIEQFMFRELQLPTTSTTKEENQQFAQSEDRQQDGVHFGNKRLTW